MLNRLLVGGFYCYLVLAGPSVCPDCGGTTELFEVLCCNDESDCWCRLGECNCDCTSCRDCTLCQTAELT